MGGGSGGGGFSSRDMSGVVAAADSRLKELASNATKILFACEQADHATLVAAVGNSAVFSVSPFVICSTNAELTKELPTSTFVVIYTAGAQSTSFLDGCVDAAVSAKKPGVHVRANSTAIIPPKVSGRRWKTITWKQLEDIFA